MGKEGTEEDKQKEWNRRKKDAAKEIANQREVRAEANAGQAG